jgi:hypothetical protein
VLPQLIVGMGWLGESWQSPDRNPRHWTPISPVYQKRYTNWPAEHVALSLWLAILPVEKKLLGQV